MTAPLSSIPSLVPIPAAPPRSRPHTPQPSDTPEARDALADRFAALFSPPTPSASRARTPPPPIFAPPSTLSDVVASPRTGSAGGRQGTHARLPSLSDEFGAFVSVPATDDPLVGPPLSAASSASAVPARPIPAPQLSSASLAFFENFGSDAREAEKGRRGVLEELLAHEDDPLYWVKTGERTDEEALSAGLGEDMVRAPAMGLVDEQADTPKPPSPSTDEPNPLESILETPAPAPLPIAHRKTQSEAPARPPLSSSPAPLPITLASSTDSTSHPSPPSPRLTRNSFSSRWLPALLARPSTSSVPLTASASTHPSGTRTPPSTSSSPQMQPSVSGSGLASAATTLSRSLFGSARTSPASSSSLPTLFNPPALTGPIAPENPFAKHTYVPPSGAPGFAGDHAWAKQGFTFDEDVGPAGIGGPGGGGGGVKEAKPPKLLGRKEMTGVMLDSALAASLRAHLPALPRLAPAWTLLYSLDQHGISLHTLYTRCAAHPGPAVLALRDAGGATFGAVVGGGVVRSHGGYYGGGESFLWTEGQGGRGVEVFRWTGRNEYVALCEADAISFGGGDGQYGLFLDESLFEGSSAPCPTFANPPLCTPAPLRAGAVMFECVGLEVWGVGP